MNDNVSEVQTRQSPLKPSKPSEGTLVDAVTKKHTGRSQSSREQSLVTGDIAQDTPLYTKRRRDATSGADRLPTKRARLTGTDTQQPRAEDKEAEQGAKTTLQQPKPRSSKRPHASSLELKVEGPEQGSSATRLQKREISSDSESDNNERQPKRVRLTRKNLTLFNKMARKKGSKKVLGSGTPESTTESSTKTISTSSPGFAEQAYSNKILLPCYSKPPGNLEGIRERHSRSRGTTSPPESEYGRYVASVQGAPNEATIVFETGGALLKKYNDTGYRRAFNQAFTGFPQNVGFNNGLSAPQPDFVEGLERNEYNPVPVNKHVNGAVLYKNNPLSLALPHLAGEWKGHGKDLEKAKLQSAYDGAALVYARNQALSLIGKPDSPGHAEVTTFATDGTNLHIFAHYAAESDDGLLEYHQHLVKSTNLVGSYEEFKDGRKRLRNEQDRAREQSYALRDQLKEYWKQRRDALQATTEKPILPVPGGDPPGTMDTCGDEDEDEDVDEDVTKT
ncbi:hypothetical protein ONZ43_g1927 [Nemania bipapillata]|uniref:Uncharacterized protein n=1 Tax=Nemania bipapillata TaxID=110536 RepID=A0ACC2J2J3_9PEZI|nr:hypothetical protein ONZ43_g1927 [Nemania bipapillata]